MTHPLVRTLEAHMDAEGTAGTPSEAVIGEAPFAGTVTAVRYIPEAAITGAATNHKSVQVYNRGGAGAGTTVVATLAFDNGVNATAWDAKAITLAAAPATTVAAGDLLTARSVVVGTGMALPAGKVEIDISRS
jgi:hypothetical protein